MDIKVKDIAPANQTTPVKGRESSGDFKILIRKLVWKKFCEK